MSKLKLARQRKNNKYRENKAQVSIEFIITIVFILLIFSFGLALFQNRTNLNSNSFINWEARLVADKIARNINYVGLLDNNSEVSDYIFWSENDKNVIINERTVQVEYYNGRFTDSPFFYDVNNTLSEFDGLITYRKINNQVVIE
jgi:uncharacterized protein (UPF0333 family)